MRRATSEYYIVTGIDITDRYRADQELLKSEIQFRIHLGSLLRAHVSDRRRPASSSKVNAAFAALLGTEAIALEGMNMTGLFHPE